MDSGIFGRADLAADTDTVLFTVDEGFVTTNIRMVNRGADAALVRVAVIDGSVVGGLTDADYLEYDADVYGKGILEQTGIVVQAGKSVVVRSDKATVNAVAFGIGG